MINQYSVLMSVYFKEQPEFLEKSVESTMQQSIAPTDFVIVCDGLLTEELYATIEKLKKKYNCINVVKLEKNNGLGIALSEGLKYVKKSIVMRMDSDDICEPDRAEIQLPLMEENVLVGGWISEFEGSENNVIGIRTVPASYKQIVAFSKKRCPFNHPSVMFNKDAVIECGGYVDFPFLEDYYLWIRMLQKYKNVCNVQKCLVNMRSGLQMRTRRSGKQYKATLKRLRKYMLSTKYINVFTYIFLSIVQNLFLSLPIKTKHILYKKLLRKSA